MHPPMLLLLYLLLPNHPSLPPSTRRSLKGSHPRFERLREPCLENRCELFFEMLDKCVYMPIACQIH